MSDELIRQLQGQVTTLTGELAALRAENKTRRQKQATTREHANKLQADHDQLLKERDEWKGKAETGTPDLLRTIGKLQAEIRTRDHRGLFDKTAAGKLRGDALDAAWKLAGYSPDGDAEPDFAEAVGRLAEQYPFLAAEATGAAPAAPLKVPAAVSGQGSLNHAAGQFRVTSAQMADHAWVAKNEGAINKAAADGTLSIV